MSTATVPDGLFFVWREDDIDSSFFEDTDEPQPLYVCCLCRDTDKHADIVRGYDPRDGIFERPGTIVESVGGVDTEPGDVGREYRRTIERELLSEFEARRESMIVRGEN